MKRLSRKLKTISVILVSFLLIFSNCLPASAAYLDNSKDVSNIKEKQLLKKIDIIKQAYPKQIDKEALFATLSHRGSLTTYMNESYDPNFDENEYRKTWDTFGDDFAKPFQDIAFFVSGLTDTILKALDCLLTSNKDILACVTEKKLKEAKVTNVGHTVSESIEKINTPQSIDLLTAATLVMLDSSGWIGTYSDEKYKKALANDALVGSFIEGDDPLSAFAATTINAMFCTAGAILDFATDGKAVDFAVTKFNPEASFTNSKELGVATDVTGQFSRYLTMSKICAMGYIGGTYPTVMQLEDQERKQAIKDKYAEEIIKLAELFRSKDNSCVTSSTGAFSSWKQYDPEWGGLDVGGGGSVSSIGCLITSLAIQMARSGTQITNLPNGYNSFNPGALVTTLNQNGGFVGAGAFAWRGYESIASNWRIGDLVAVHTSNTSSLASKLSEELATGAEGKYQKFILLQLRHNGSSQHWVAVDSVSGNNVTIFDPGASGNTLDDNYSGWVVMNYRVVYATDVELGKTGTSTGGADYCETSGDIIIPEEYGNGGFTVTFYHNNDNSWSWARNSNQGKLYYDYWLPTGAKFDNGIAVYDNRYLIACTETFGQVGDKVDFFLDDGTKIPCIIADIKSSGDAGYNEWGHNNGQNVLEFEVSRAYFKQYGNPGSGQWFPEWSGKRVSSAKNLGSIW